MREITILQDALIEARRLTREASAPLPSDTLTSRISRLIASHRQANHVLLTARAEASLASQASVLVTKSLTAK